LYGFSRHLVEKTHRFLGLKAFSQKSPFAFTFALCGLLLVRLGSFSRPHPSQPDKGGFLVFRGQRLTTVPVMKPNASFLVQWSWAFLIVRDIMTDLEYVFNRQFRKKQQPGTQ